MLYQENCQSSYCFLIPATQKVCEYVLKIQDEVYFCFVSVNHQNRQLLRFGKDSR